VTPRPCQIRVRFEGESESCQVQRRPRRLDKLGSGPILTPPVCSPRLVRSQVRPLNLAVRKPRR
jgi:hypothetical protein